jgi:hypothetical protein
VVHNEQAAAGIPCFAYRLLTGVNRQADFGHLTPVLHLKPVQGVITIIRNGEIMVKIAYNMSQFHREKPSCGSGKALVSCCQFTTSQAFTIKKRPDYVNYKSAGYGRNICDHSGFKGPDRFAGKERHQRFSLIFLFCELPGRSGY